MVPFLPTMVLGLGLIALAERTGAATTHATPLASSNNF